MIILLAPVAVAAATYVGGKLIKERAHVATTIATLRANDAEHYLTKLGEKEACGTKATQRQIRKAGRKFRKALKAQERARRCQQQQDAIGQFLQNDILWMTIGPVAQTAGFIAGWYFPEYVIALCAIWTVEWAAKKLIAATDWLLGKFVYTNQGPLGMQVFPVLATA